jgi:urease accessory protein UreE
MLAFHDEEVIAIEVTDEGVVHLRQRDLVLPQVRPQLPEI